MGLISNVTDMLKIGNQSHVHELFSSQSYEMFQKSEPASGSKSIIEDPFSSVSQLGFKDKPYSLTYDTLKKMAIRNSVISSIILTRINQVSTFTQPARFTKDGIGFEITLKDTKKQATDFDKRMILALESFIENCGYEYDPTRDNFDTLIRKTLWDSLTYDQLCIEIVEDRVGRPAAIYAVDGATIRAAEVEPLDPEDDGYITNTTEMQSDTKWVQVIDGVIQAEFTGKELVFAVRNPRSDIAIQPYGFSELEILIHQVTSHLWAEQYNSNYFSQGGTTKGILNLKGQNISKTQLDSFRRQWTAQLSGLTGSWKTPVVSVEGLEYINVSQSNREMEYEMWMNYLINICCAVYQIDPAEINFPNRGGSGGGQGGSIMEGGIESRLKNSRDKGLRPLLRFLESIVNKYIIRRFSDDYQFNFVGLDQESEQDRAELNEKLVRTRKTINELRKENDDDPIDGGDIILDPTYTNYLLQLQQMQQMQQGQPQDDSQDGQDVQGDGQDDSQEDDTSQDLSPEEQQQAQQDDQISQGIEDNYNTQ